LAGATGNDNPNYAIENEKGAASENQPVRQSPNPGGGNPTQ